MVRLEKTNSELGQKLVRKLKGRQHHKTEWS